MRTELKCQSCGAPQNIETGFAKIVACEYCGAVSRLEGGSLVAAGASSKIASGNALFKLGSRGTLSGAEFRVLGRVRYHHEAGVWDEWQLLLDGHAVWLQHDEGELALFEEERIIAEYPLLEEIGAGSTVAVEGLPVFVSEVGEAVVAGLSGQIPRDTAIGQGFFYLDGLSKGRVVSMEYYFTEVSLSLGRPVRRDELKMLE
jgi:hypothetical protein